MKYYVMEITTYNDGTAEAKGVYAYDTQDEAIANYHSKMGGAMKNAKYESELITVTAGKFPGKSFNAQVKIRSVAKPTPAKIELLDEKRARVTFEEPQRAVSKGQSLVMYDGNVLIGGGFIAEADFS